MTKPARVFALLALPLLGLLALVVVPARRRTPDVLPPPASSGNPPPREIVVRAALSQLGNTDPAIYWADAMPGINPGGADWCGAFALWCLHQAGLALELHWELGSGFLLSNTHKSLPTTAAPLPGDVAYFDHLEHEAIVETVTPSAVGLINGNGTGGAVTRSSAPRSSVTAFFSIEPLIAARMAA